MSYYRGYHRFDANRHPELRYYQYNYPSHRYFTERDILTNCRSYPRDEAPGAYKDFDEVLGSVKQAGLAREVARLEARFVIKDAAKADD